MQNWGGELTETMQKILQVQCPKRKCMRRTAHIRPILVWELLESTGLVHKNLAAALQHCVGCPTNRLQTHNQAREAEAEEAMALAA